MKKRIISFMMVIAMGIMLTACGSDNSNKNPDTNVNEETNTGSGSNSGGEEGTGAGNDSGNEAGSEAGETGNNEEDGASGNDGENAESTQGMVDAILTKVEQPALVDMTEEMVKDMYYLDPALLEQFTAKMPMMNVKTNEIAIMKVKAAEDIATVEEGIKKRAADVQKQFESYLPDQYENAKNYKIVVKDNYVLFVISESADSIIEQFNALFE